MTVQELLYTPPASKFTNSTFCPHTVFMCFVWIWEQTAIISLYIINWLVLWPRRSVFTARYGMGLYIQFRLIILFKGMTHFATQWSLYTGCPRRNVPDFGRVFLMLKYTDITQNTYVQSWTVTEIMAREVWNFDSCYSHIDYQIHIETGRNMWFL